MGDATFWALVALIIFLGIVVYMKVPGMIAKSLDDRADKISNELEEARKLREEAQALLAEYQKKRKEAEKEAAEIVEAAKREAETITAKPSRRPRNMSSAAPRLPSRRSPRPNPTRWTRSAGRPSTWRSPPRRRSSATR
jgi:vacuolar-type H+-ATPase subunit H